MNNLKLFSSNEPNGYYVIAWSSGKREVYNYYQGYPPPIPSDELWYTILGWIKLDTLEIMEF